jgi:alpha-beta hydrolase superfamily lysophospholipase
MWIRDDLAKHARGTRAIIYGYDTKLDGSSSFQNINDLAKQLIDQLHAYRQPASKAPIVFLAHSLGGLVVKQALRTLAEYPLDEEYKSLLGAVRGAIFFGVPNLGMEQRTLQAIVQDNPNGILIRDLSQRSNFIHQLTKAFFSNPVLKHCKFFWAYETQESPTAVVCDYPITCPCCGYSKI